MKERVDSDIINTPGRDKLWLYFGLSYASWLTLPRVLMHEMPDKWQEKMAKLLNEYNEFYNFEPLEIDGTRVQATKNGKLVKMPNYLINYRHPSLEIDKLKSATCKNGLRAAMRNETKMQCYVYDTKD